MYLLTVLTTCNFDLYCSVRCVIVLVRQYDDDDDDVLRNWHRQDFVPDGACRARYSRNQASEIRNILRRRSR